MKPKSEFTRNVLTLMTGTTIAQAIPIAISPILTRIYSPEDFGVFALFVAISMVFGSIANGRYELAIMLPAEDEDAFNIAALGVLIALCLSFVLLLAAIFLNKPITNALGNEEISFWLYFVPVAVLFMGLFNVLNYFNNRMKNYKDIARATIYKSLVLATVQLAIGFLKPGATGLISGQILSNIFANLKLLKNTLAKVNARKTLSVQRMRGLAKRYKDFPKFSMWAILANNLSQHLVSVLISIFYSVATLGFYSLVQKVLGLPSTLIGNAISQVYFQHATQEKKMTGKATRTFTNTFKKLFLITLPTFTLLFFLVEDIFALAFGEEWRTAGVYAKILIPLFAIRFIFSPLSITCSTFERQKLALAMQIGLLLLSIVIMLFSALSNHDFIRFLVYYTLGLSVYYVYFILIVYRIASGRN